MYIEVVKGLWMHVHAIFFATSVQPQNPPSCHPSIPPLCCRCTGAVAQLVLCMSHDQDVLVSEQSRLNSMSLFKWVQPADTSAIRHLGLGCGNVLELYISDETLKVSSTRCIFESIASKIPHIYIKRYTRMCNMC